MVTAAFPAPTSVMTRTSAVGVVLSELDTNRVLLDGFESGDTSAWSNTMP